MTKKTLHWRAFEDLVARIQRELAPAAEVNQNELIVGMSGVPRRLDVTVRQMVGAYPMLIAFDCKRHTRKVGVGYIAAFADQVRDVGASLGVLISNTGFTKGSPSIAKVHRITLQTLREAEEADWARLLGPETWHSILAVAARHVDGVAIIRSGEQRRTDLDRAVYDSEHRQAETIGQLFWDWWKCLGVDRQVGPMRFEAVAAPGEVFIQHGEVFEEVERFQVNIDLVARRWLIPLQLNNGVVLLNQSGDAAYREFTTSSFEWQQIMSTEPGEVVSPEEFARHVRDAKLCVDLAHVKRFLRLVVQSKPTGTPGGGTAQQAAAPDGRRATR